MTGIQKPTLSENSISFVVNFSSHYLTKLLQTEKVRRQNRMECFFALVVWSRSIKTFCFDREQMDGMEDEKKSVEIYVERLTTWIRRDCLQWQNPTKLYAGCSDISPCWHHELFTLLCTRYCLLQKALWPICSTKNLIKWKLFKIWVY